MATPAASGVVLTPWPNRIRDGRWTQRGTTSQLAITEPKFMNASHGLLRFVPYEIDAGESTATLRADVYPQTGYPFHLETAVTYALTSVGITVTHTLKNIGSEPAPVALGTHPYLTLGDTPASELTVTSSGSEYFVVDDRMLPTGSAPVTSANDLRGGAILAGLTLDTAYRALTRDAEGRASHTLRDTSGRCVTLWQGEGFDYVQFYTARPYPGREVALACEPMTAPADAFNSGEGLRWLEPGESWTLEWGVTYTA